LQGWELKSSHTRLFSSTPAAHLLALVPSLPKQNPPQQAERPVLWLQGPQNAGRGSHWAVALGTWLARMSATCALPPLHTAQVGKCRPTHHLNLGFLKKRCDRRRSGGRTFLSGVEKRLQDPLSNCASLASNPTQLPP
jgi:hypothetical protein